MGFRGRRRRPAWCLRRRQEQDSRDAMEGWMDVLSASDSVLIPEAAGSDGKRRYSAVCLECVYGWTLEPH